MAPGKNGCPGIPQRDPGKWKPLAALSLLAK